MTAITTHVLDTARGLPAAGLPVRLYRRDDPTSMLWDASHLTLQRTGPHAMNRWITSETNRRCLAAQGDSGNIHLAARIIPAGAAVDARTVHMATCGPKCPQVAAVYVRVLLIAIAYR